MARRKHIHTPEENTCCLCDHTNPKDGEHFKICPLHTGRDTLLSWYSQEPYGNTKAGQPTTTHTRAPNTSSGIPWSEKRL